MGWSDQKKKNKEQMNNVSGIMVVPLHQGEDDKLKQGKPVGPFRNLRAARNWINSRLYSAKAFDVVTPEETFRVEASGK